MPWDDLHESKGSGERGGKGQEGGRLLHRACAGKVQEAGDGGD